MWLTNFDLPGEGYLGLKELSQLRELTLMMCNASKAELEQLEVALPNTFITSSSGGWGFQSKNFRKMLNSALETTKTTVDLKVDLNLERNEYFLGESIAVEYEMTNTGNVAAPYGKGGYYPDLRVNDGFRMTAVRVATSTLSNQAAIDCKSKTLIDLNNDHRPTPRARLISR